MKSKRFWIKERFNPQFDKPYYVAMGQLSDTAAKKLTRPIYGDNVMYPFQTENEYKHRIEGLRATGFMVQ